MNILIIYIHFFGSISILFYLYFTKSQLQLLQCAIYCTVKTLQKPLQTKPQQVFFSMYKYKMKISQSPPDFFLRSAQSSCCLKYRSTWTCKNIEKIQQNKHFLTSPSNYVIQWMMQLLIEHCWSLDSMLPCLRWLISLHAKQHDTAIRRNASTQQAMTR